MKKILFFLVLSITLSSNAQDVLDTIAKETCDCITNKNLDFEKLDKKEIELTFGLCMIESYSKHSDKFSENEKLDFTNSEQMENFGGQIGLKMLPYCPDIFMKLGSEYEFDSDDKLNSEFFEVVGELKSKSVNTFYTLKIKENTGRTVEVVILDYFDNSYLIFDDLIKNSDKIKVKYYEIDLYDHQLKRYVSNKVVTDIIKL